MPSYIYSKKRNQLRLKKENKGIKLVLGVAGVLLIVAIFVQLYVMSVFATKGDEVARLENRKAQLITENKKLNQEIADARNVDFIKQKTNQIGYVDINLKEVNYLQLNK